MTNNPDRAEDYLKRAEELEEAQVTVGHRSSDGRLVLMGRGDSSGTVRESVSHCGRVVVWTFIVVFLPQIQ